MIVHFKGGAKMIGWVGVDPGQGGAAALIDSDGQIDILDWPGDPGPVADTIKRSWMGRHEIRLCAIELVHAMPKQGVSSMFKFGVNYGQWQGVFAALNVPYVLVSPREWQRALVLPSAGANPKERSLTTARRLFPNAELGRKKDHGRSDALLLAWWARGVERGHA
jgi:hypothetical protein